MVELLRSLIKIPRFSGEEKAAADFFQARLNALGLSVHRTGNNLWVESEPAGNKPSVLLNAHIDTVRPASSWTRAPFDPSLEGGVLYGLGSNDDGGSIVSLLEAYRLLSSKPQPYRLVFSVTAEEETGGSGGIEMILPEIGGMSFGIVGEPTGMDMAVAEKGLLVLDCISRGVAGHAARDEGDNAIYKAVDDIGWFRTYRFGEVSDFCGEVKMSVTQVNAGSQHNAVPDLCTFVVDIRSNGLYSNRQILDTVAANVACEVVPRSLRHNGKSISLHHPAVLRGLGLGLKAFGSGSASNQTFCPFPTLKMGPGMSSRSHGADEYIRISELEDAVRIYVSVLDNLYLDTLYVN